MCSRLNTFRMTPRSLQAARAPSPPTMRPVKTHSSFFFNLSQPASQAVRLIIPHGTPGLSTATHGARTLQETEPCRYGPNYSQMHVQMNVCFSYGFSSEPEHKSGTRTSVPARCPGGASRAWRACRRRGRRRRDPSAVPGRSHQIKTTEKLDNRNDPLANMRSCLYRYPMTRRTEQISLHLNAYLTAHSSPPDAVLRELANETADLFPTETGLQIAPEQGTFMTLLTQLARATSALEIGTFTGYSSICIARGLVPGGTLLCCDISEEWTWVAKKYWEKAGLEDRIELRLGPAMDTLLSLPEEELFDLAFIDADKSGYLGYWRQVVPRIRAGGLIMVDNTFSHGRVIDAGNDNPAVIAVRDFNDHAAADDRVDLVMVPIGDGLTLARKK